jgi:two-component system cell cycle response regulator DivK
MRTILVVEDYTDVRQMLKVLLESEKFRVLEAATGSEALEVIKEQRPDAILMDLALPGFDGLETIRRIRAIDGFQNTPVVVLTAYTGPSTYETAIRAGSDYFMGKPIDFDELAGLLKQILLDENTRTRTYTRAPSRRAVLKTQPPVQGRLTRRVRNLQNKRRTFTHAALDCDESTMKFGDLFDYRQTQSHATFVRLLICL